MDQNKKIKELEKRIKELEQRPVYVPYPCPVQPIQEPYNPYPMTPWNQPQIWYGTQPSTGGRATCGSGNIDGQCGNS